MYYRRKFRPATLISNASLAIIIFAISSQVYNEMIELGKKERDNLELLTILCRAGFYVY